MALDVDEVLEGAKTLGRDQVADLAYQLIRVLDDGDTFADQARVEAEWRDEFRRRIDDIDSGTVELVDGRETLRMARAMRASRRG